MNVNIALAERKAHLSRKLGAIRRMMTHVGYSRGRLRYPIASVNGLSDPDLESVSALLERFGKLQDLLGSLFRELLALSGEGSADMNDVISRLEKLEVLDSADDWRALRVLRNAGAHDYDDNDADKTEFINEIAAQSANLIRTAERVLIYCRNKLNVESG